MKKNVQLCKIKVYYGFDYSIHSIYDVINTYGCFKNPYNARKSRIWKELLEKAKKCPDGFIETDSTVACKQSVFDDSPFLYGDVMENKFSAEIILI